MFIPVQTKTIDTSKGYAILEILLAFGVAMIIIVGMVYLGVVTIRATTTAKSYAEAGKIAQREVTRLKLLRDTSTWSAFTGNPPAGVSGCSFTPGPSVCHIIINPGGSFSVGPGQEHSGSGSSIIYYSFGAALAMSGKEVTYQVTTTWIVGITSKTYKIEGILSNWREN